MFSAFVSPTKYTTTDQYFWVFLLNEHRFLATLQDRPGLQVAYPWTMLRRLFKGSDMTPVTQATASNHQRKQSALTFNKEDNIIKAHKM